MKRHSRRFYPTLAAGLSIWLLGAVPTLRAAAHDYQVVNLVSDVAGAAAHTDTNLVNAWGLEIGRHGTLIIASTETSQARFFGLAGAPMDFAIGVDEDPTGVLLNRFSGQFRLHDGASTRPSELLFVTEEGKIMGWNRDIDATEAVVAVDNSGSGAVYKGVAQAHSRGGPRLYATNFRGGQVEVYDGAFHWLESFTDPGVDTGFAPFNVVNIDGLLFVTFAKLESPEGEDDEPGPGNGFVDIFTPEGHLLRRLVAHRPLNSPWGLALAPHRFGRFGGSLLIGNFGDGKINAFHPVTGEFLGSLATPDGTGIIIDGLWSLKFAEHAARELRLGDGDEPVLYFTSGPGGESHGLVGAIIPTGSDRRDRD